MPTAEVNGVTLHYVDEGAGAAVLFLHGITGDHSGWNEAIERISAHHRAVALDNRGAGRSTQTDDPVTTEELARDVLGLLDALGVKSAHIVGRSMGGAIAQHVALHAPARVDSLVLCASFAKLDPLGERILGSLQDAAQWTTGWGEFARHAAPYYFGPRTFAQRPALIEAVEASMAHSDRLLASYLRQSEACLRHDVRARAGEIRCPTLIVAGGRDPICSKDVTEELARVIPQAEVLMFEEASHFCVLEESHDFLSALQDWLQRGAANSATDRTTDGPLPCGRSERATVDEPARTVVHPRREPPSNPSTRASCGREPADSA